DRERGLAGAARATSPRGVRRAAPPRGGGGLGRATRARAAARRGGGARTADTQPDRRPLRGRGTRGPPGDGRRGRDRAGAGPARGARPCMANIPADLRYTKEHEYVKQTGADAIVQIGITDYAQGELGDVVFVDLPKVGAVFARGDVFGTIEAVKAVSELYAPLAGTVTEVNKALEGDPALVNRDPYGAGWMIKLRAKNTAELDQLLTSEAYKKQ